MMTDPPRIKLGRSGRSAVYMDIAKLVATRMLVQANSGGGKSYAVRVLAEQAMNHVQTIVLDPDGEFASLRELHDVLLVGSDGELPPDVRGAGILARRLAEKGCSAVIDLYDLDLRDKARFVKDFCHSLLKIPKGQFHPMLVFLDEAPDFCPERGIGQSIATEAVISLMARGRKRGIGMCLAAQRMSQLHKTATAQANNYLLGRTAQDTDRKRVAQDLGLEKKDRDGLRNLADGQFWALGPAFSHRDCRKIQIAEAETTHPEAGAVMPTPPPASKKMLALIRKEFSDLPERAREEATTLAEASAVIKRLENDKATLRKQLDKGDPDAERKLRVARDELDEIITQAARAVEDIDRARGRLIGVRPQASSMAPTKTSPRRPRHSSPPVSAPPNGRAPKSDIDLPGGRFPKMMQALGQHGPLQITMLAVLVGMTHKGGGFRNYLGKGKSLGVWKVEQGVTTLTAVGRDHLPDLDPLPDGEALVEYWCSQGALTGKAKDMLRTVAQAHSQGVATPDLAVEVGMAASGGGFRNYVGRLRALHLISSNEPLVAAEVLWY